MLITFLTAMIFVLAFILPIDLYWLLKLRHQVPSCAQEAKDIERSLKYTKVANYAALILTIIIALAVFL